jgi:hypothetical protein
MQDICVGINALFLVKCLNNDPSSKTEDEDDMSTEEPCEP